MLNITQYEQLEKAYGKTLREIASGPKCYRMGASKLLQWRRN